MLCEYDEVLFVYEQVLLISVLLTVTAVYPGPHVLSTVIMFSGCTYSLYSVVIIAHHLHSLTLLFNMTRIQIRVILAGVDGGVDSGIDSGVDGRVDSGIDSKVQGGVDGGVDG